LPRITKPAKHGSDVHCGVIGGVCNSADEPINLDFDFDFDLDLDFGRRYQNEQRGAFTIIA
jgi:hypothetical protein